MTTDFGEFMVQDDREIGSIRINPGTCGVVMKGDPGLMEGGVGHIEVTGNLTNPPVISTRLFQLGCDSRIRLGADIAGQVEILALAGRCRHCDGAITVLSPMQNGLSIADGTDGHLNYNIKVETPANAPITRPVRISMSGPWNLETAKIHIRGSNPEDVTISGIHEEASQVDIDPDGALRIRVDSTFSPASLTAAQSAYLNRHSGDADMTRG